jgi:hypothetical protein
MKKWIIILLFFWAWVLEGSETKIISLPGHSRPAYLAVDRNNIYISDFPSIYIYSLDGYTFKKKFGKKGEGPREFLNYANITLFRDKMIINSVGKISFFTREGDFLKEKKLELVGSAFKPVGNHYGVYGFTQEDKVVYQTINVYDAGFKKVKEIYRYPGWLQLQGPKRGAYGVNHARFGMLVYEDKMVVMDMEDFKVYVWHEKSDNLITIKQDYEKLKFTAADKNKYLDFFKTDPNLRGFFENLRPLLTFPDHYPPIRSFGVGDGKIFVITYEEKNGKSRFFIFNMNGEFIKTTFLPLKGGMAHYQNPYFFSNGKMYQLVENEDEEEWELHITEIE